MSTMLCRSLKPRLERVLLLTNQSTRHLGTQPPRPSLPSRQPVIETFSETSRPRPYYANHPPFRELPRLKVYLSPSLSCHCLISECQLVQVAFRSRSSDRWGFRMGSVHYLR